MNAKISNWTKRNKKNSQELVLSNKFRLFNTQGNSTQEELSSSEISTEVPLPEETQIIFFLFSR